MTVIFLSITTGLLLSLIKQTSTSDIINTSKTIYYNGEDITMLMGRVFDLRYYDKFETSLISRAEAFEEYLGYASVCQAQCSRDEGMAHVLNAITLDQFEAINITESSPNNHSYIKLIDTTDDTPSLYLLKGSIVSFKLELSLLANSSEVELNIFSNVLDCEGFYLYALSYKVYKTITLSTMNNYTSSLIMTTDDYICVVAKFPDYDIYPFSVKGSVHQYHDISYLSSQNLCAFNDSLARDVDGVNAKIMKSLDRPLKSLFSPIKQEVCLLITIRSACAYTTCDFGLKWSISATFFNPGVILTLGVALFILIITCIILLFLCVLCLKF